MRSIKFSSNYPKLHNQMEAKLVNIEIVSFYELHNDLIEYDTKNTRGEYYKLPKSNLIHLTFIGNKFIPFCTIRKHTTEKYAYYKSHLGETFNVEIIS